MGESPFSGCKSLESLILPNCLKTITAYYFKACDSLATITLPESVVEIEDFAFTDCKALKDIWIKSKKPMEISGEAFNAKQKKICIIHVPIGYLMSFKASKFHTIFKNIIEEKIIK
jgi:hypothetical protein